MKIAVWGVGSHAQKNALPALAKASSVELHGIFSRNNEVVQVQADKYGCRAYESSESLLADPDIEGVYLATPVGLHFSQGKMILEADKHLFVEKSSVASLCEARSLTKIAKERDLIVAECFMYKYHNQCQKLLDIYGSGELGEIRQIEARFGFPHLASDNIRYKRDLGGGALFDAGAYPLSLVSLFTKDEHELRSVVLTTQESYEVDTDGSAFFVLDGKIPFMASWGIGRDYKNEVEVWGEKGSVIAHRFFSKPETLETGIHISRNGEESIIKCPPENHFVSMFSKFIAAGDDSGLRFDLRNDLIEQANLMENVMEHSGCSQAQE